MFILFLLFIFFQFPFTRRKIIPLCRRVSLLEILKFSRERETQSRNALRPLSYLREQQTDFSINIYIYILLIRREDLFATRNKITHSFSLLFEKSL